MEFRDAVRQWAADHVRVRTALDIEGQRRWFRELHAAGYAAPHWSREWGGSDLSVADQIVLFEELSVAGAPDALLFFVALNHTYATLTGWGTREQCERFLPRILAGEDVWCQGFSEPEAGSDLAAVRTRAVRSGDRYVVNGQKIWSSRAQFAQWCLLLVRTDPEAPKHRGLSMLLLDLSTPGVDVRPIRQATGESEFCEIFLTDVEIPADLLVGAENDGWRVCQTTLSAERGPTLLELSARAGESLKKVEGLAIQRLGNSESAPPAGAVVDQLARLRCEVAVVQMLCRRVVDDMARGAAAGAQAGVIKVAYSELQQRIARYGVELAGADGQEIGAFWMQDYLASWAWLIGGGTNDILRNVIAERVLGLPRWPDTSQKAS